MKKQTKAMIQKVKHLSKIHIDNCHNERYVNVCNKSKKQNDTLFKNAKMQKLTQKITIII